MTAEEKAEQWVETEFPTLVLKPVKTRYRQAYIAGYNACLEEATHNYNELIAEREKLIPKWHKVADELPPKMGLGSKEVYIAYADGVTDFGYYRFDNDKWYRSEDEEICNGDVVAWTEIPTYEE